MSAHALSVHAAILYTPCILLIIKLSRGQAFDRSQHTKIGGGGGGGGEGGGEIQGGGSGCLSTEHVPS